MRKKIGIIGYGALGAQIERFMLEEHGKDKLDFYYFDDTRYEHGNNRSFRFNDFDDNKFSDLDFYIGVGYHHLSTRKEICEQLIHNKFQLPSFVHRTAYINPTSEIGQGVYVYPMCNVDQLVHIKNGVIINNSVTISHNSIIGTSTFIAPGVTLAGNVKIGECCFVGTGSVIANNITVGNRVRIGIGSNITRDVEDGLSVIGNPFKIVSKKLHL